MLESYTQLAKDEILFVQAAVDEEQVEVLIFKVYIYATLAMNFSYLIIFRLRIYVFLELNI